MRKLFFVLALVGLLAVPMAVMAAGQSDSATDSEGPIEIHIAMEAQTNTIYAEGEDLNDNLWTRRFLEDHNVQVIIDWVSEEYDTSLNLAIASKQIPDAFKANNVQFGQLVDANLLEDLREGYDNFASPSLRQWMGGDNASIFDTAVIDGELLAIPDLHFGYETKTSFLWARLDWLEEQGITELNSFGDIEKMMDAFKNSYGAETGLMLDGKTLGSFFQMSPIWHSYPKLWVEGAEGDIVYGATLPETKAALAQFAEWYSEGYIRSDFATLNSSAMLEDAYNGKSGMYPQQNWAGWQVGQTMILNQGDNTYFVPLDMPTADGEKIMYPIPFPNNDYNVVRKGYEHPEVLVKLINTYVHVLHDAAMEGSMTIEEVLAFNLNDMQWITGPFKISTSTYRDAQEVSGAIASGVEEFTSGNAFSYYYEIRKWLDDGEMGTPLARYLQMGFPGGSIVQALDHVDGGHLLFGKVWGLLPSAARDVGSTLDDLLIEGYAKIITGNEPISYYETLIDNWRNAGGDRITAEVNAMYGNN